MKGRLLFVSVALLLPTAFAEESPDRINVVFRAEAGVFVSGNRDEPEGFDVEMVKRFVAWYKNQSGRPITYTATFVDTLNDLIGKTEASQCDMAIGSVTATAERDKRVDFSNPYLPVRIVVIAPVGAIPKGDIKETLAGKTVGALQGSTHAGALEALVKEIPGLAVKTDYLTAENLFGALRRASEVDAVATDLTHYWVLKKTESIELVTPLGPEQGLAFVLPEGSTLKPPIDEFLDEFLHSPSYFTLVRQYFGQEADEMIRLARKR